MSDKVTSFIPDAIREAANTIAAAIRGGSGGTSVEWSQIVTTGTKIATITIDDESTDVYAPAGGGGGSSVSWNEIQTTGTKIAQITIDGETYDVYAPNVSVSAADVSYDNSASGLSADDAQEAIDELAGDLSTLSGTVSGHTTDIGNLQTAVASKADQSMIAPVETVATASQAYAIGEQFILNGVLYTATAAISAGGTITIGGNCTASDSVTEQIANAGGLPANMEFGMQPTTGATRTITLSKNYSAMGGCLLQVNSGSYAGSFFVKTPITFIAPNQISFSMVNLQDQSSSATYNMAYIFWGTLA